MGLKTITVTISKDANDVKTEASGYTGNACLKDTESLEEALGKVTDRKMKPEGGKSTIADKTQVGSG